MPHISRVRDADAALVDWVARLDGDLVVVEDPVTAGARCAALVPAATGKRLYSGMWHAGRSLREASAGELDREMQRWGVRHALAWSKPVVRFLDASPLFQLVEDNGRWQHYGTSGRRSSPVLVGWPAIPRWAVWSALPVRIVARS